jgi:hypothetical protein
LSPSIIVTKNPNWSTNILWFGTSYAKEKILSLFKCPTRDKLHYWFCLKLLRVCWIMLWWSTCNILDSSASEYSTTNTFNSDIDKCYVTQKNMVFLTPTLVNKPVKWIERKAYIFFIFLKKKACIAYHICISQ